MRFGLVHRIMTDALAALGLLALLTSGELNRWMTVAIVLGLLAALAIPERWQEKALLRRLGVIGPLLMFGIQAARLSMGEALLPVSIEFAAGLQVLRLLTRRGAAHDQQVVVLALLHLIAGTVLGAGLAYGLCFLGFMIVAPGALVLSHLRREVEGNYRQGARDRTGLPVDVPRILRSRRVIGKRFLLVTCLLSVPIFVFTAALFMLFPRVGLSLLLLNNPRERMTGFSERVDLGGVGKLRSDPTIVMRVEPSNVPTTPPARLALYLKGTAFDVYDGRSWSRSHASTKLFVEQSGEKVKLKRYPEQRDTLMRVDLEAIDPAIVFLPGDAVALRLLSPQSALPGTRPQLYYGNEGTLYYKSIDERGLRYAISLAEPGERKPDELTAFERSRYLALPALPERIAALAETWTADLSDPREMARRIEARLRSGYTYDLDSPAGGAKNPLDHFLFESKRGHCEFYSTAMAVMLRTRGIPTRNVTGFVGGTFNRFSQTYAVRQGDAHSWVEVYLNDTGWTRFDPTPPSGATPQSEINGVLVVLRDLIEAVGQRWNRHVVGYDLKQQISLLDGLKGTWDRLVPDHERGSLTGRFTTSPQRALLTLVAVAGLVWAGRELWLRRRRTTPLEELSLAERRTLQIVELYQALDRVMSQCGAARPAGTPPLAHARSLVALNHPIGNEVLELTEIYLRARFGGELLPEETVNAFASRVRVLKQPARPEKAAA